MCAELTPGEVGSCANVGDGSRLHSPPTARPGCDRADGSVDRERVPRRLCVVGRHRGKRDRHVGNNRIDDDYDRARLARSRCRSSGRRAKDATPTPNVACSRYHSSAPTSTCQPTARPSTSRWFASARDPESRIGSLLVNPGGPGASGVELARAASSFLPPDVLDRFDVIGWDPRGVGGERVDRLRWPPRLPLLG